MSRKPGVIAVELVPEVRQLTKKLTRIKRDKLINELLWGRLAPNGGAAPIMSLPDSPEPEIPEIEDDEVEPAAPEEAPEVKPLPMPEPPKPPPPPAPVAVAPQAEQVEAKQSSVQEVELVNDGVHYIIRFMPGGTRKFYRVDAGLEGGRTLKFLKDLAPDTVIPEQNIVRGTIPGKPVASSAPAAPVIQPPPVVRPTKPAAITYPFEVVQGHDRFKVISIGGAVRLMKQVRSADGKQVQFQPVGVLNPQQVREWWGRKV